MKALIVIDMQEAYLENRRNCPYDIQRLVNNINKRIADYNSQNNMVIYIKNKGKSTNASDFTEGLLLVSDMEFEKEEASCFSNQGLRELLLKERVTEIEIVGVDGNYCVGISALEGVKLGFLINIPCSCIGITSIKRFALMKEKLLRAGISVV